MSKWLVPVAYGCGIAMGSIASNMTFLWGITVCIVVGLAVGFTTSRVPS